MPQIISAKHTENTRAVPGIFSFPPSFLPGLWGSPITQNKGYAVGAVRLGPWVTKMLLDGAYWVQTVPVDTNVPFNTSKAPCPLVERGFPPGNIGLLENSLGGVFLESRLV